MIEAQPMLEDISTAIERAWKTLKTASAPRS